MLGVIAALALVLGGVSAAVTVSEDDQGIMNQSQVSQVETQAVANPDSTIGS
jgi:hypothetical protein